MCFTWSHRICCIICSLRIGDAPTPAPGGVLIQKDGVLLGAVGVSGDTSDNDEICAVAGIEAAGLKANAG
jgi:uncharacterized protein GlcG (DUF336 family)